MEQRVLLVDDEESFRQSAVNLFATRGVRLDAAADLRDARERSAAARYNFAIIDLKMPDDDGVDVARELRKQQPDLPVVYLTGFDAREYRKKAAQYHVQPMEWLRKPMSGSLFKRICAEFPKRAFEERFLLLADMWRDETQFTSSLNDMAMHPAYQSIIGMGPDVVPLIIRALKKKPEHWFWALASITGENPVRPADRGRVDAMAEAWLAWARSNNITES